ncbi:hypothetical protein V1264_007213 [Littorina saxatilis]|uniref:Heparanase n=1 Tax=Littorina saxatilis TaxID=31220 RepID=A0AAN9AUC2_9CAEN
MCHGYNCISSRTPVIFAMPITFVASVAFTTLCLLGTADAQPHNTHNNGNENQDAAVVVTVNLQQSKSAMSSHFVGVTIDSLKLQNNWGALDFTSKKLQNLARALTPCYLRVGGTMADNTTYDIGGRHHQGRHVITTRAASGLTMTADNWRVLNEFNQKVGWDFIFDLNALKRNADGSWNPDNARQLLQFSADRNYTIAGFELGNEYDIYRGQYGTTLSPDQLARDVAALQKLLAEFPKYRDSFIVGPETAGVNPKNFRGFLAAGGAKVVRAASFHQYYFEGSDGHVSDFTSIHRMDSLASRLDDAFSQVRSLDPLLPVWLSETSSASSGGMRGVSDRFVAGFLWLDKLGMCALKGVETVLRQAFYAGHYGLINQQLNPNPDFWLTVLYKRIVSGAVFNATGRHDIRVYAACANPDSFKPGSVVVCMLNPNNYTVTFDLHQFHSQHRLRYSLTAGDHNGLVSLYMSLNGVKLQLVHDALPPLTPESAPPGLEKMAAHSYTFLVFPEAQSSICLMQ